MLCGADNYWPYIFCSISFLGFGSFVYYVVWLCHLSNWHPKFLTRFQIYFIIMILGFSSAPFLDALQTIFTCQKPIPYTYEVTEVFIHVVMGFSTASYILYLRERSRAIVAASYMEYSVRYLVSAFLLTLLVSQSLAVSVPLTNVAWISVATFVTRGIGLLILFVIDLIYTKEFFMYVRGARLELSVMGTENVDNLLIIAYYGLISCCFCSKCATSPTSITLVFA
jgi:hypothetical protein